MGAQGSSLQTSQTPFSSPSRAVLFRKLFFLFYLWRGTLRVALWEVEDGAIADFARAIELDPKNIRAYELRSLLNKRIGDLESCSDYSFEKGARKTKGPAGRPEKAQDSDEPSGE